MTFEARRLPLRCLVLLATVAIGTAVARSGSSCGVRATASRRYCATVCRKQAEIDRAVCGNRDAACLSDCRLVQLGCSDLSVPNDCREEAERTREECAAQFSDPTSREFLDCLDEEGLPACAADALANQRFCARSFGQCLRACPRGARPDGRACRRDAGARLTACLALCDDDLRADAAICAGRLLDCTTGCSDRRLACDGDATRPLTPIKCKVALLQAVAACNAQFTRGSDAWLACIAAAKREALRCAGAVEDSATPALVDCDESFDDCVIGCPAS